MSVNAAKNGLDCRLRDARRVGNLGHGVVGRSTNVSDGLVAVLAKLVKCLSGCPYPSAQVTQVIESAMRLVHRRQVYRLAGYRHYG